MAPFMHNVLCKSLKCVKGSARLWQVKLLARVCRENAITVEVGIKKENLTIVKFSYELAGVRGLEPPTR